MGHKPTTSSRDTLVRWLNRFDILAHEYHRAAGRSATDTHDAIGKTIASLYRNDRALAQDGYFVWQPIFTSPLKTYQIFPFRVFRGAKREIVAELASIGYTRERMLGDQKWLMRDRTS